MFSEFSQIKLASPKGTKSVKFFQSTDEMKTGKPANISSRYLYMTEKEDPFSDDKNNKSPEKIEQETITNMPLKSSKTMYKSHQQVQPRAELQHYMSMQIDKLNEFDKGMTLASPPNESSRPIHVSKNE